MSDPKEDVRLRPTLRNDFSVYLLQAQGCHNKDILEKEGEHEERV